MRKQEFLQELRDGLTGLPKNDLEKRIAFYAEMIDDRVEEGLSEEEAVAAVGTVSDIILQVAEDYPEQMKLSIKPKRKMSTTALVLLILGSPIWASLLIAAFAVVFSLIAALWAVIVSLWAVFGSLVACAPTIFLFSIGMLIGGNIFGGLAVMGGSIVCGGLAIFCFFGCRATTKGAAWLTKGTVRGIARLFRKEGAQ